MINPSHRNINSSADIKNGAKSLLKDRWTGAVLTAIIPTVFSMLFLNNVRNGETNSLIFELIESFLVTGMTFGFMNVARNQAYILRPLDEMKAPFQSEYFKNLLFLHLWKLLFITLWSLLFVIPGIVKAYSYSQSELLYKDYVDSTGEQPDARMIIGESSRMMSGYKGALFLLDFSFLGWHILNAFTLGILGLWLTPYTAMSRVVFYELLTAGHYSNTAAQSTDFSNERSIKDEEVGKDPNDFSDFEDF